MLVLQKRAKIVDFEFLAVDDSCTAGNLSMQDILLQNIYTYISSWQLFNVILEYVLKPMIFNDPSLTPKTTTKRHGSPCRMTTVKPTFYA